MNHFCTKHNRQHSWLLTSSYCSLCEQEKPATRKSAEESDIKRLIKAIESRKQEQTTLTSKTLQQRWEAQHGKFYCLTAMNIKDNYIIHVVSDLGWKYIGINYDKFLSLSIIPRFELLPHYSKEWSDEIATLFPITEEK